ncbi:MAG: 50S ribosomal protein L10 [Candidatus Omnitrophica bacterium CG1_02_44_16]|nr:MAG: 50S ribosomal protein L10 [Candidatus Omnitrophica bacterium CG1_02_44_16]
MSIITNKIGEFYRGLVSLELKRRLSDCSDVFLFSYHKLRSAEMTLLRKDLKNAGASILVTKNSFTRKIFEEAKVNESVFSFIDGPMALVFVKSDPIATAKVLMSFLKEHEALQIRGGFMRDRVISFDDVKRISKLGSKQALYGQVASTLNAPIVKLAVSMKQIVAKLVYALSAAKDKKSKNT